MSVFGQSKPIKIILETTDMQEHLLTSVYQLEGDSEDDVDVRLGNHFIWQSTYNVYCTMYTVHCTVYTLQSFHLVLEKF